MDRFIKEGKLHLIKPITDLFNSSLKLKKFPMSWKSANVMPLHKKDSHSDIGKYRPVALLSVLSKIFEKIIFKRIYNHVLDNFF